LDDLAFTLGERRSKLPWRAAVPAASWSQLIDFLDSNSVRFSKAPKTVALGFVFTGQGAQWHAMGQELVSAYHVSRDSLGLADKYVRDFGASWSLIGKFSLLQSVYDLESKTVTKTQQMSSPKIPQPLESEVRSSVSHSALQYRLLW
jgi:acyl transferase domain-containing protein